MAVIKNYTTDRTIVVHDVSTATEHKDVDPEVRKETAKIINRCKFKISCNDTKENIDEEHMMNWCLDNLTDDCVVTFLHDNIIGYFENELDATAFKLRWL